MMLLVAGINVRSLSSLRVLWLLCTCALASADDGCSEGAGECSSLIQHAPRMLGGSSRDAVLASSIVCNNGLSIDPTADIILTGPTVSCEFIGIEMFASLKLENGASAMLSGGSVVHGSVECLECGHVKLISVEVLGTVLLTRGQKLDVAADVALAGGISVEGPNMQYLHVDGSAASLLANRPNITSISAIEPGELHIRHARVVSGVSAHGATQVVIDQAIVGGEVHVEASSHTGGVAISATEMDSLKISSVNGDIDVGQQTDIASSLLVNGGNGEVHLSASRVGGDLQVIERNGRVLLLDGSFISNGVKIEKCSGDVVATGLEIGNGAFSVSECEGDCNVRIMASIISLGILVQSGQGRIDILQVSMPSGDLSVSDRQANAQGSYIALRVRDSIVSDILMERITGNLWVENVSADSDVTMAQVEGEVNLMSSVFQGDFKLHAANALAILESSFKKEDVMLSDISGRVAIIGNSDFNLVLEEIQGDLLLRDNNVANLQLSKNYGRIELINNTIEILTCADNAREPIIRADNIFLEPVVGRPESGQCAL
eukprot:CAMPEP_0115586172 /NCGR_PEP_ID=MMETSP0272-20121206/7567_1 /TAXON_ID=71861 /ORGANISM="Scrippsiella trochoidea, Strain CCMP3099" /LENGTH=547 /DNA_ID=CAMNT_0003021239 /DNA_START=17 /DNA_END=1660 /DNA_ORIENTATION=-